MEEFATIMFVWMIYLAISAAVTYRKHLRIDFLLDMMPFKVKKVMLIISNVIFALFTCISASSCSTSSSFWAPARPRC